MESTTSSTLEVKMTGRANTIEEVAERKGVASSALRHHEERGTPCGSDRCREGDTIRYL
jgi:hypothetical protein